MATPLPYRNSKLSILERVEDLLARMTTEEKVGQLVQANGAGDKDLEGILATQKVGSFLQVMDEKCTRLIDAAAKTRLGIPLIFGVDAIHGYCQRRGATIFPTQLGIAQSWNEEAIENMAAITAAEMYWTGPHWTFSPVLCIARDLRWGRVGETFGEDPWLIGRFGCAMIRGYQGSDPAQPGRVAACAKHYAGYSETQGGRDASEADLTRRKLTSFFLPPFEAAATAGAATFMTGYQSMDGVPSTANRWLLRETLKEEWGFNGFLVTDWNNVGQLVTGQKICPDFKDAAAVAVECGNDMIMSTPEFYQGCLDALASKRLEMKYVDEAVRRVLTLKFRLGLFENPRRPNAEKAATLIGCAEHRRAALAAARESLVLLENDGILPLADTAVRRIALVGANADHGKAQNGDWSYGSGQANCNDALPPGLVTTIRDGLRKRFPGELLYEAGCTIEAADAGDLERAKKTMAASDLVVAVVGDRQPWWGEWKSTATLELPGNQKELLEEVAASGKPFILVMLTSKVLVIPESIRTQANAIIQAFSPGMHGGTALAELLFGDIEPCGRLTISMPYHVGQQPVYYQQIRGKHGDNYADLTMKPVYGFGYGLLYTDIDYECAELKQSAKSLKARVRLRNRGERRGVEVIQAYVSDLVTSATWAEQELKGFARVALEPGEVREIEIEIPVSTCSIVNRDGKRVVEPGDFELRIGKASNDIRFTLPFTL